MPCRSDYLEPRASELESLEVIKHLKELGEVYNYKVDKNYGNEERLNKDTKKLCGILKKQSLKEIKTYSLKLQLWWEEHQKLDEERLKIEKEEKLIQKMKNNALAKLTDAEKILLKLN